MSHLRTVRRLQKKLSHRPGGSSVTVTWPKQYFTAQRDLVTGRAVIVVQGTCATNIDTVWVSWNDMAPVAIAASAGAWSGSITVTRGSHPLDNQGVFQAWASNSRTKTIVFFVGVGDLLLVIGQSNFVGRLTAQTWTHPFLVPTQYDETLGTPWKALAWGGGIFPRLATSWMAEFGHPIGFIDCPKDGTGYVVNPAGGDNTWWATGGGGPAEVIANVAASNINGALCAVSDQGGADSTAGSWGGASAYKSAIDAGSQSIRDGTGFADLQFLWQMIHSLTVGGGAPNQNAVRGVHIDLMDGVGVTAGMFAPGVINIMDLLTFDGAHITTDDQAAIWAARFHHALKAHVLQVPGYYIGPRFVSASKQIAADQVRVSLTVANGGLTLGAAPTRGWRVVDDAGTRTISDAATSGSGTAFDVDLTLDQAHAGTVQVSWGKDADANANNTAGSTIVDALGQPPVPFFDQVAA